MKKIALISFLCLIGLSAQAMMNDWQNEPNSSLAEVYAFEYFQANCNYEGHNWITRNDIRDAMKQFPNFLKWMFKDGATITHLMAHFPGDLQALRYLLGFSPNLEAVDNNGKDPIDVCGDDNVRAVLTEYKNNPWRHPNDVLSLRYAHIKYIYDDKRFGGKKDLNDFNDYDDDDDSHSDHVQNSDNGGHRSAGQLDGISQDHDNGRDRRAHQLDNGRDEKKLHNNLFDLKTFLGLGAIVIFLIYRYKVSKDEEQNARS
jgi:hypothetical protein